MTLEEKAKEYAHNNYEILIDTDDAFVTSEDYLEQGYLAGAKENGFILHDLEKDSNDLPKENKMKDNYRFWSRKKLKKEIISFKESYTELFYLMKEKNNDFNDLLKAKMKVENKLSDARIKNRNLVKENNRLKKEEQALYDCIQKWYEPTNEKKMIKLIKETEKVFESFVADCSKMKD